MNVTALDKNSYFIDEGNIYQVLEKDLNKNAMRKMVAKYKVKNMRTGAITDYARNSGYDVEEIKLSKRKMAFLYDSGDSLVFMNNETFDQIEIAKSKLEWEMNFITTDVDLEVLFYEEEILGITLPPAVDLKVTECELSVRGDTINKALKNCVLETGYKLRVPMFINEGEKITIKTETGEYAGRAGGK